MKKLFVCLLVLSFILPQITLGIGQMTKPIIVKDALRGQVIESVLTLYNSEEKEVIYKLAADGKIEKWTSFYKTNDLKNPINEIKIPAKSRIEAIAKFIVPKETPNGEYKGEVAIISVPEKKTDVKVNASVGMRIGRQVAITVTDKEIIQFDASVIPNKYDLAKNESLSIRVIYDNRGNVNINPQIQLRIKSAENGGSQTVSNTIYPYPESEQPIAPLARAEIPAINVSLSSFAKGRYIAEFVFNQGGVEISKKDFNFSVDMPGINGVGGLAGGLDNKNIVKGVTDSNLLLSLILAGLVGIGLIYASKKTRLQKIKNYDEKK